MWYECVSVQLRGNIKTRVMISMLQHRAVVSKSRPVPYQMGILLEFTYVAVQGLGHGILLLHHSSMSIDCTHLQKMYNYILSATEDVSCTQQNCKTSTYQEPQFTKP